MEQKRCPWCVKTPIEQEYHDTEWGVPVYDDKLLFEYLLLEGAQAGLSWVTILKKRENYRAAFDHFDAEKIALYNDKKIAKLLQNAGIVRNKLKVNAFIRNAQVYLDMKSKGISFSDYLWDFVDGKPIQNKFKNMNEVPAQTEISHKMSKSLKKKGFKFVGPTIVYAFMQASGLVNDHEIDCFRYKEIQNILIKD